MKSSLKNVGLRFPPFIWSIVLGTAVAGCGGGSATSTAPLSLRTPFPESTSTPTPSPSPTETPPNVPAGQFREYRIPTPHAFPEDITAGPDGALWITEAGVGKIGRITTAGRISEFPLQFGLELGAITPGPDGALWFTEENAIGRMTTAGQSQTFVVGYQTAGIAAGPDGALWFTGFQGLTSSSIGRITTSGQVTSFALPPYRNPMGITTGPDGALWFAEGAGIGSGTFYSAIGRMTTTGAFTEFGGSQLDQLDPAQITTGPDGALWFTNLAAIGRMTTSGQITFYEGSGEGNGEFPGGITAGPDGNVWSTGGAGEVERITTKGQVTTFPVPFPGRHKTALGGIAAGPDGAMWFVDTGTNAIGRVTTGDTPRARVRTLRRRRFL